MTVPSKSQCHHDGDDRFEAFEKEILEACKRTWDDDVQANENAESILAELHRCDASGREYYMTDRGEYYYYVVRHFDVDGYVKSFFDELHRVDGFIKPGSYIRDEQPMGALEHVVEVGSLGDSKHMEPLEYMEAIEKGLPDRKSLFFHKRKNATTVPSKRHRHHDGDDRFEAFEEELYDTFRRVWEEDEIDNISMNLDDYVSSVLDELYHVDDYDDPAEGADEEYYDHGREYYMTDKGEYYYYRVSHGHRIATGTSETLVEAGELSGSRCLHPLAYMKSHTAVKKLKDSGMPEKQAESVVEFQARLINQNLATKAEISDLTTQNAELRTEFTEIRTGTKEIVDLLLI